MPIFPEQNEFNLLGYALLAGVFLLMFISIIVGERKLDKDLRPSISFRIFISIGAVLFFLIGYEDSFRTTYYFKLFGRYVNLAGYIFLAWIIAGGITFCLTWVRGFYKLYVKKEVTPFMYRLIKFIDALKKATEI